MTEDTEPRATAHDRLVGARTRLTEVAAYLEVVARALDVEAFGSPYAILLRHCDEAVSKARLDVQSALSELRTGA